MNQSTSTIRLTTPVADLPSVSKRRAKFFLRLEINSVTDLLRHLPMRNEQEEAESNIDQLVKDTVGSVRGEIAACRWVGGYGNKGRFEVTLQDDSATLNLVWFNARYLIDKLHPGLTLRVQGKVKMYLNHPQMVNPRWDLLDEQTDRPQHVWKLRPIYPATEGLSSRVIESLIEQTLPQVFDELVDPLPDDLRVHHHMPELAAAFTMIHHPANDLEAASARRRLAYNELLLLQLGIAMKRAFVHHQLKAPVLAISEALDAHICQRFPFDLTEGQRQVIGEIAADLQRDRPMNRLLQGDVGSGKTVVALYAMLAAVANHKQAALMVPTELLAEQHYLSISKMLEGSDIEITLLTAGQGASQSVARRKLLDRITCGGDLIIGTQAILHESEAMKNLAVIVIDEQHRFGVIQRAAFRQAHRGDLVPHHLVMTATPIPRTLGLTLFGDLDVSTLLGQLPGRTPIVNRVVMPGQTDEVYRYLRTRLERGEQAYVVVPAIDAHQKVTAKQLRSVNQHAALLQDKYCQGYKVAAMHGRLKRDTRERIMDRFRSGKIDVLVATTVIEVGVDVPNASMMVIEHAERFGLAQLHQLRGRVGRSGDGRRSLCVFICDPVTDSAEQRIKAIGSTNDGFKIAEMDFDIRGMGEFFGTRQSGAVPLRIAQIPQQMDLLQLAKRDAEKIIDADAQLTQDKHQLLRQVLVSQFGESLGLIDVG